MPIEYLKNPRSRFSDGTGKPLSNGTVGIYVAGTSFATLATVWDTVTKDTELTNPVTLDSAGEAEIWYDVEVDLQIKNSSGTVVDTALGLNPNASASTSTGFNLAQNGSFETDSTSNGQPDNWTIGAYSGSAIAISSSVATHGTNSLEFNTGAAGTGGGTATSTKFPVTEGSTISLSFSFYATHATTLNTFSIKWYDETGALQSTSTVTMPASGVVPTSWTNYQEDITVDAAGTQGEIVLAGIVSSGSNLTSKAYFDGISILNDESLPKLSNVARGVLVYKSANETLTTGVETHLSFNTESYDTDGIHDNATNNQRLTVPVGVTKIKLHAQVLFASNLTSTRYAMISKNDESASPTGVTGLPIVVATAVGVGSVKIPITTTVITVVAGDYFTLAALQNSGGNLDVEYVDVWGYETYFAMEIIK